MLYERGYARVRRMDLNDFAMNKAHQDYSLMCAASLISNAVLKQSYGGSEREGKKSLKILFSFGVTQR